MLEQLRTTLRDRDMMERIFRLAWPTMIEEFLYAAVQSVLLTLIVGGALTVIMLPLSPFLPRWLGGAPEILRDASLYLAIVCAPMLFRAAVSVFGAVLRATGDTNPPCSSTR